MSFFSVSSKPLNIILNELDVSLNSLSDISSPILVSDDAGKYFDMS